MDVHWRHVEAEPPARGCSAPGPMAVGAREDQAPRLPVPTPHPGNRIAEAHLVELGQLAVGRVLLGCVLRACRQSRLSAQHLQEMTGGRKRGYDHREGPGLLRELPPQAGKDPPGVHHNPPLRAGPPPETSCISSHASCVWISTRAACKSFPPCCPVPGSSVTTPRSFTSRPVLQIVTLPFPPRLSQNDKHLPPHALK